MKILDAVLTGSRAYGTPRPDSDIDLVLLVSQETVEFLANFTDYEANNDYAIEETTMVNLHVGPLNLICYSDRRYFDAWRECTNQLIDQRPVKREDACNLIGASLKNVPFQPAWERQRAEKHAVVPEGFPF